MAYNLVEKLLKDAHATVAEDCAHREARMSELSERERDVAFHAAMLQDFLNSGTAAEVRAELMQLCFSASAVVMGYALDAARSRAEPTPLERVLAVAAERGWERRPIPTAGVIAHQWWHDGIMRVWLFQGGWRATGADGVQTYTSEGAALAYALGMP